VRAALAWLAAATCCAQDFTQRGFVETAGFFYPETALNDRGHAVGSALLRYEAFYRVAPELTFAGGFDARVDTHGEVERRWHLSWQDRERLRPAFAIRRLSATYARGAVAIEIGKQFIRWGKADILNPTDYFAPRDFVNVVQTDFLPVTAARVTYGGSSRSIDLVFAPRLTPSRVPLLNKRWAVVPEGVTLVDAGSRISGGGQYGARWNHIVRFGEYSISFFDGFHHLPLIDAMLVRPPVVRLTRVYPRMRSVGGDAAVPLRWVTLKAEAAYFDRRDEYVLWVLQAERQSGEWIFAGGYAGEKVLQRTVGLDFAPDRGLARAFLGRAAYTIDTNRSVAVEAAVRHNGDGVWIKSEYSHAFRQHWRATAAFTLIRGDASDFLGQYRRNSHFSLILRYSF
jgi:hypothetical protein